MDNKQEKDKMQAPAAQNTVGEGNQPGADNQPQAVPGAPSSPQGAGAPPPLPYTVPTAWQAPVPVPRQAFKPQRADAWFAAVCVLLGYWFVRWNTQGFGWQGWRVSVFTLVEIAAVLAYARAKNVKPGKESWYWLAIFAVTGGGYAVWTVQSMMGWQALLLLCAAIYWPVTVFGGLLLGKTSNFFLLDAVNIFFIVPLQNFLALPRSLAGLKGEKGGEAEKEGKQIKKNVLGVLLGGLISLPVLVIIFNLLFAADTMGGFQEFFDGTLRRFFDFILPDDFAGMVWSFIFGVPVAIFFAGVVIGYAHRRYTGTVSAEAVGKNMQRLRVLPKISVFTLLTLVCGVYTIFIATQVPYFFSAFTGRLPEGYEVFAFYARDGFFELCTLVAFNLVILLGANILCRAKRSESGVLRIFNIALSMVTILLTVTAFSKMGLYISVYGLTAARVQVCAFLIFLVCVWAGVIVWQFKAFNITRFSVMLGAAVLCLLCVCNIDMHIANYNVNRYIAGTIQQMENPGGYTSLPDACDVIRSEWMQGSDVDAALKYYHATAHKPHRNMVSQKLGWIYVRAQECKNTGNDTLWWFIIRTTRTEKIEQAVEFLPQVGVLAAPVWHAAPVGGRPGRQGKNRPVRV